MDKICISYGPHWKSSLPINGSSGLSEVEWNKCEEKSLPLILTYNQKFAANFLKLERKRNVLHTLIIFLFKFFHCYKDQAFDKLAEKER